MPRHCCLIVLLLVMQVAVFAHRKHAPVVTFVTALWQVSSPQQEEESVRAVRQDFIKAMLQTESNLIILGNKSVRNYVNAHRNRTNTVFVERDVAYFESKWYASQLQTLWRVSTKQTTQAQTSQAQTTQAQHKQAATIVSNYSKLALMSQALHYDIFQSDYFIWIDAGLTTILHPDNVLFSVLEKYALYYPGPWTYTSPLGKPTIPSHETHPYMKVGDRTKLAWTSFFGGRTQAVTTVNAIFENLLCISMESGQLWSEEVLYTVLMQRYPLAVYQVPNLTFGNLSVPILYSPQHREVEQVREVEVDLESGKCSKVAAESLRITVFKQSGASSEDLHAEKRFVSWMLGGDLKMIFVDSLYLVVAVTCLVLLRCYSLALKQRIL